MNKNDNDYVLTAKELAVLLLIVVLATPIVYNIVMADFGWWLN